MTHKITSICPHCKTEVLFEATKDELGTSINCTCCKCGKIFKVKVPDKFQNEYEWVYGVVGVIIFIIIFWFFFGLPEKWFPSEQYIPTEPTQDNSNIQTPTQESSYQNTADVKETIKNNIVWVRYDITKKDMDGSASQGGATGSGVLYSEDESNYYIFTNRHVIDCDYAESGSCYQRINEKVTVRTQDGVMHDVKKVLIAPHNLDIAVLEIDKSGNYQPATLRKGDLQIGEKVIAIGYPAFTQNVLEFSISEGQITAFRDLLMVDGFAFNGIDSDAYTYHGSSGGGLFDSEGNLIGITTWGTSETGIAIKISVIDNFNSYNYCPSGTHIQGDKCMNYCSMEQVLGSDGGCYNICKEFYCNSQIPPANDPRCRDAGYILGSDRYCHPPCGSSNSYCIDPRSVCLRNRCFSCSQGYPYEDGTCRS